MAIGGFGDEANDSGGSVNGQGGRSKGLLEFDECPGGGNR